jgi:hypothetical protein|tara:strand:+ start:421 stop:582 length:162 start_codon:yes stop_codon:yes gene_type:complete
MELTLKEKIARSRLTDSIKQEISNYEDAIKSGSKFSDFCATKITLLNEKLEAI